MTQYIRNNVEVWRQDEGAVGKYKTPLKRFEDGEAAEAMALREATMKSVRHVSKIWSRVLLTKIRKKGLRKAYKAESNDAATAWLKAMTQPLQSAGDEKKKQLKKKLTPAERAQIMCSWHNRKPEGCSRDRCGFKHVCSKCGAEDSHGRKKCPQKEKKE